MSVKLVFITHIIFKDIKTNIVYLKEYYDITTVYIKQTYQQKKKVIYDKKSLKYLNERYLSSYKTHYKKVVFNIRKILFKFYRFTHA